MHIYIYTDLFMIIIYEIDDFRYMIHQDQRSKLILFIYTYIHVYYCCLLLFFFLCFLNKLSYIIIIFRKHVHSNSCIAYFWKFLR